MQAGRVQQVLVAALVAGSAVALGACGSTKTVTQTNTVVTVNTTTVTTTLTEPGPTATTAAAAPAPAAGSAPVLSGAYSLDQTAHQGCCDLPNNPHDGFLNPDLKWTFMNGSCSAGKCQVDLRRTLSDSTIEDLTLFSNGPAGVYTGTIPGGDGDADCGAAVKLSIIIRVGGLQNVNGQTIASRLAGHIFADYQCPGEGPSHQVSTYVGTHS